jgi:Cadherin domain.
VAETAVAKTLVGKAIGMDQEDADSLLTFALVGTSDEFDVSKSGRITVKKSGVLDYETTTSYVLEIYVTDMDSMSDTARFLIIVDDVNEAPEIEPAEFHVAENSPAKTKVGRVVAHDAEDPDSVLVFSLAEKSNEFEIFLFWPHHREAGREPRLRNQEPLRFEGFRDRFEESFFYGNRENLY